MQDLPKLIERIAESKNIVWKDIRTNNSCAHPTDKVPSFSKLCSAKTKLERR